MSEYEHTISVHASPESIFTYVANVHTLSHYLPALRRATLMDERTQVQGAPPSDIDGHLHVDPAKRRAEWIAQDGSRYAGWLEVHANGGASSRLTMHLSFTPQPADVYDRTIQQELEDALVSIQHDLEGKAEG